MGAQTHPPFATIRVGHPRATGRSQAAIRGIAFVSAALLGVAGAASDSNAQAVVRVDRATIRLPVRLTIASKLGVAPAGEVSVVGSGPGYMELELPLSVAANTAWTLAVAVPGADGTREIQWVRDHLGQWVAPSGVSPITLVHRGEPSNRAEVLVRLRVASAPVGQAPTDPAEATQRLRLLLRPADGGTER